jgi:Protein of unknown function (DUF2510)
MMATPLLNETATAGDLLFGGQSLDAADALVGSLREQDTLNAVVARFPGIQSLAEREVAREANGLLSLDLFDLLIDGWKKYDALIEVARRTRDKPGTEEKVELATHQIKFSQPSSVEVFVNGKSAGTLEVELSVAFKIAVLRGVVSEARLTAIETGTCTVTGAFAVDSNELAKRQRGFDLPGAVRMRGGVPLLARVAESPTAVHAAEPAGQAPSPSAGWFADPALRNEYRFWDGSHWSHRVANHGNESSDPLSA